ncbi:four helix bundle protein [Patescibacteria group bacterium]|nr:four helix bundle protein [Patescibacteria group bacterium]
MRKKFLKLEDITAYQIASILGDYVWEIVSKWDIFAKKTIGSQFIRAIDSVAANIAEGFGRFHKKDKQKFYYNARGSLYESAHWCKKAYKRKLLTKKENEYIMERLRKLPKDINILIKLTGNLNI